MARARCRLGWLLFAVFFVLAPARVHAQPTPAPPALRPAVDEDVTILTPRPVPPLPTPSATIDPMPDIARFAGQTLTAFDVVIDDNRWPDERVPTVSTMHAGDKVSTGIIRRAMKEALESGHFADARVTLSGDASGVRATLHVMPRKIIDAARADVHRAPIDGDDLLRDSDIVPEAELVGRDLPAQRARIEAQLQRHGFPAPQVTISTRPTDDPLRVIVIVDVNAGALRKIERRVVYPIGGTRAEGEIADKSYGAHVGDRADEGVLDADDAELQVRVRQRGFHRAEVSHDVVLHKGIVTLRIRVDFGIHFETRYDGNDHYDRSTLDAILDLESETDRTPNHLVQKIRDFYVKHGFLDADLTLEDRGGPNDAVHYLVFHVVERKRVYVAGRSYPCLRVEDVKRLSNGGPTSASGIGSEIDSYLEEELPGGELLVPPRPSGLDKTIANPFAGERSHPAPLELDPDTVYAPETYERAVGHVQELYRSEGFLSAQVGPVQVMRRRCDPRSPPGECRPIRVPAPPDVCTYDATGLPLPVPPLDPGSSCVSDPAHGVTCEDRVWLRIATKLGPRTQLWDAVFDGANAIAPSTLNEVADLKLGNWVSTVRIEEARRRVADAYKEEGYAFVDVKYTLEQSPDRTRARVRFQITEGEKVIVKQIIVRGNVFTRTPVIERRIALMVGKPYRASEVRKTEERIATLGAFGSVNVALENPYVPQRNKVVIVTVVELPRQYVQPSIGFSTGEGFRVGAEYGHRNLWGNAVQLTLRLQLAYIPTPLIIDDTARDNYRDLTLVARIAMRATAGLVFPEIGLGPLVRVGADAILVHDLQRDFYLTKIAVIPNVNYRPISELQFTVFQSFELNNSRIFQQGTIDEYLQSLKAQNINTTDLQRELLVPDGESYVFSQRLLVSWDRRDNAFNASRGTYIASGIEHVDGFPVQARQETAVSAPQENHFFKFTQTFGGYLPITAGPTEPGAARFPKGIRIAALTRLGMNVQIARDSTTYPDRLFFLGGTDSMRGWTLNSFIPQDDVDRIFADKDKPDFVPGVSDKLGLSAIPNAGKFTQDTRPIRAGNLMANERVEIRIPIKGVFETVLFSDIGNLWIDPTYPFDHRKFPMRVDVGSGIRVQTLIGPLVLDYGINVTREDYEDFGSLNFAIGLF